MIMLTQTFSIDKTAHTGMVGLKVADLTGQIEFYTSVIGLTLLEFNTETALLGVEGLPLLMLRKVEQPNRRERKAGLYHIAFLLPERKDLGNTLFSLLKKEAAIIGASDHGYSEALYLEDPEGNGIEIYRDKPKTEWSIQPDGRISGITVEMDAAGVLASRDEATDKFPAGTTVGHVHLSVADLAKTEAFYIEALGLGLKDHFGSQASFFAAGGYHHHIGTNVWLGKELPAPKENDLGLDYFTLVVSNQEAFLKVKTNITEYGLTFLKETSDELVLLDPSGIMVRIEQENS
ncbi:VOC family protein [Enterococcus sp. LJL128]